MRKCEGCPDLFEVGSRERNVRKWCSEACRMRNYYAANTERVRATNARSYRRTYKKPSHNLTCTVCGCPFVAFNSGRLYCSDRCRFRQNYLSRRGRQSGAVREPYSFAEVVSKNGFVCALCADPIDKAHHYPLPSSASIDHIVPLSRGGEDTLANVQLAHLGCNWSKGARTQDAT